MVGQFIAKSPVVPIGSQGYMLRTEIQLDVLLSLEE